MMFAQAMLSAEPTILNSNLLPVKANGEVLFRSVVSLVNGGRTLTPSFMTFFSTPAYGVSFSIACRIPSSSSPRKIEITAGGASFAPRRWSLPAVATEMRRRS